MARCDIIVIESVIARDGAADGTAVEHPDARELIAAEMDAAAA